MKLAGVECLLSFQLSWALENTLRLEVDVLRAFCDCRAVFSWSAAVCLYCFHLCIWGGSVCQFCLFLLAPFFFSWCTCVAPVALLCVLMTMSRAVVVNIAVADESDYVLMMVMLW